MPKPRNVPYITLRVSLIAFNCKNVRLAKGHSPMKDRNF
jgi:hypothetical protein